MRFSVNTSLTADGDMSANVTSSVLRMTKAYGAGISAIWSDGSTPVGTLKLQASNSTKDNVNDIEADSWVDVTDSSQAVSGDTGGHIWDIETFSRYLRVVYTRASGSGTLNITACVKGV